MVGLNKSDVGFDYWACIFDPPPLGLFMRLHVSCIKMLNVGSEHVLLITVCCVFQGLAKVLRYPSQDAAEVPVMDFNSVLGALEREMMDLWLLVVGTHD
jgi:hypothetical protein